MKILVFDDNSTHRAAAMAQLEGHDLTVVGTYDEAQRLLTPQCDVDKAEAALKAEFGDFNPWNSDDEDRKKLYKIAQPLAYTEATNHPDFDVVLTDLLVPASEQAQGTRGLQYVGKEMPVGIFIGLLAAAKAGAKFVAVFTDSDHHSHPASACFDAFNENESNPTPFTLNGSKLILCNSRGWVDQFGPEDMTKPLSYEECKGRTDTVRAKNWGALLQYLLSDSSN